MPGDGSGLVDGFGWVPHGGARWFADGPISKRQPVFLTASTSIA
ncbi:hypothetical protein V1273_004370 [Bradyrhizobium sp. AZCC 1721]